MILQDQIRSAIGTHAMWKGRLRSAIETGKSEFTPETVRRDDCCEFGNWLHEVTTPALRSSECYRNCLDKHRRFHETAARVITLAVAGQAENAKREIGVNSAFAKASAELTEAMMDWSEHAARP